MYTTCHLTDIQYIFDEWINDFFQQDQYDTPTKNKLIINNNKHHIRGPNQCNKAREKKRNSRHMDWKGKNKILLFTDDMICLTENPKGSIKRLLNFSKVTKYRVSIKKSIIFYKLAMNNWEMKNKNSTICNSIKKYEICKNKSKKINAKYIAWKVPTLMT